MKKALITILAVLLIDQVSKFIVKTEMALDESIPVFGEWFYIHFIENPGMAFGLEFGGETGKLLLSLFRIVAVIGLSIYLAKIIREKAPGGLVVSVALILAGALGNIIDSAFYGLIFSESLPFSSVPAEFLPEDGGYAGFLHGRVVDMLYFPIIDTNLPEWVPIWGGERFQFFRPVFNVADSAITVGVVLIILNQKRFFAENQHLEEDQPIEETDSRKSEMVDRTT